jgi:histidine triad (HIT) family protein
LPTTHGNDEREHVTEVTEDPTDCPFCKIVAGTAPATIVREWPETLAIVPLDRVVEGHLLVIPKQHVQDFTTDWWISARTMSRASELAAETEQPMNVITSRGREATQSVFHLHLHLVPRAENDGLALPWYSGRSRKEAHD